MKKELKQVQVSLKTMGSSTEISESKCSCVIGITGKCHHVAVILYHIVETISCTDLPCKWSGRINDVDSSKVQTIDELFEFVPKELNIRTNKNTIRESLKQKFNKCEHPVSLAWILQDEPPEPASELNSLILEPIISDDEFQNLAESDRRQYLEKSFNLTDQLIEKIAEITSAQMNSTDFCMLRQFRITASNFGIVWKNINKNLTPAWVFNRLLGAYNLDKVPSIQWGRIHEEDARRVFIQRIPGQSQLRKCGIYLHSSGVLGASPDGISTDYTLEIKCPFKYRQEKFKDCLTPQTKYIVYFKDGKLLVNRDHEYFDQIQAQIYFTRRKFGVLVIWNPVDCLIVKIDKDASWESKIPRFIEFYYRKFLPHVILRLNTEEDANQL